MFLQLYPSARDIYIHQPSLLTEQKLLEFDIALDTNIDKSNYRTQKMSELNK